MHPNMAQKASWGFSALLKGFELLRKSPLLVGMALLPVGITVALYIFAIPKLQWVLDQQIQSLLVSLGWLDSGAVTNTALILGRVLLWIMALLLSGFLIPLISLPFNDFLAQTTERYVPITPSPEGFKNAMRAMAADLRKSLVFGFTALIMLPAAFLPGAVFITAPITWFLMALQFLGYPLSRRGVGVTGTLAFGFKNIPAVLAFGLTVTLGLSVPMGAVVVLPLAVIGGTWLFSMLEPKGPTSQQINLK